MCGICGSVNIGSPHTIHRMNSVLAHRGPDDSGVKWFPESCSGLGQRRLAIIDLTPAGHQPMANDAETLWITFNGEIYNYREIRKILSRKGCSFRSESDTEVLLKAYEEWGLKVFDFLNGMFAFAIYDKVAHRLFAARDHIGIKPFYYWYDNRSLIFASEIKAILASGLIEKRPDYSALRTPTRFQVSPYTGFEGIYKLPPGHYMTFVNGALDIRKYWDLTPGEPQNSLKEGEAIARLNELLTDSVRLQMIADVPVGILLSGGLDSSVIAALMRRNTNQDVHSFTIRFADEDKRFEQMPDDAVYARQVAEAFDFRHHEIVLNPDISRLLPLLVYHLDEPLADPAAINTYLISKAARDSNIVVLLNGMGGDEIFGGYRKYLACLAADRYDSLVLAPARSTISSLLGKLPVANNSRGFRLVRWTKRFASFASFPQTDRYLSSDLSLSPADYRSLFIGQPDYFTSCFYEAQKDRLNAPGLPYLTKMCLNDTKVFLPEHNLTYSDKAAMAVAVETRPPLTDYRIAEFMFSLPPSFRIRRMTQKYLLKKAAEHYLPRRIVYRPKAPFGAPLRSWIRGPLSEMVGDYLSAESIRKRGLYDPVFVREAIRRDKEGAEDNAHLIWTLLTNEIWFRTFWGDL